MTVCIAAMCEYQGHTMIVCASDRMVTAGDIEFEPTNTKINTITNSIFVLTAGDSAFQAELLRELNREVQKRVQENPTNWLRVKDIVDLYAYYRNLAKLKRAESNCLEPWG